MTTLIRPDTCATCARRFRNGNELQCRRYPPSAHPAFGPNSRGQLVILVQAACFPIVQPDWWCAEFSNVHKSTVVNENETHKPAILG